MQTRSLWRAEIVCVLGTGQVPRTSICVQIFQEMQEQGLLRNMDSLALATRKVLYALPTLVAGPLMTSGHLALDSGRAARRWIQRTPPSVAADVKS